VLNQLLDLAHDVSSYLRHHHQKVVRVSAALLLASSLAACSSDSGSPEEDDGGLVEPLTDEVKTGLPSSPGRYPINTESLVRDAQGVYHFGWSEASSAASASQWSPASVSLLRLEQAEQNELEVPSNGDPILRLREDTPIPLVPAVDSAQMAGGPLPTATAGPGGSTSSSGSHVSWFPFFVGSFGRGPAYYNPPAETTVTSDGRVQGSRVSTTPPPPVERVAGLSYGVSGQSGGTGRGTAATLKSGASAASSGPATAKSRGFSGGSGGSSGSVGG
jgi:hypothetical protein